MAIILANTHTNIAIYVGIRATNAKNHSDMTFDIDMIHKVYERYPERIAAARVQWASHLHFLRTHTLTFGTEQQTGLLTVVLAM